MTKPLYRCQTYAKRTSEEKLYEPGDYDQARRDANTAHAAAKSKVITITRDNQGLDHPLNAGKFFLYQIIK